MLTDIFARRYSDRPIWKSYGEGERRLLNQAIGVLKDALLYYNAEGKEILVNKAKWQTIHDRLARELGLQELSQRYYSYSTKSPIGQEWPVSGYYAWDFVCQQFITAKYNAKDENPDAFIKERVSLVELGLRVRGEQVAEANASLPSALMEASLRDRTPARGIRLPGSLVDGARAQNARINADFAANVEELNERFRQARAPLTYHNGFIQLAMDERIEEQVARPFWGLVADPMWANVDIDMKEALDRRDSNDKDPALFAAKALESAIKIISDQKRWTRGTESGAAAYVDNLMSKANGAYLAVWEGDMLKDYFRKVRNSLGHGPGSEPMPTLSLPQTDWAIEAAMSWVRTLARRM